MSTFKHVVYKCIEREREREYVSAIPPFSLSMLLLSFERKKNVSGQRLILTLNILWIILIPSHFTVKRSGPI